MPDQEIADALDALLDRLGVRPERRALVYRQLIARQLVARGATPQPARDRVGSEHLPLEERDFLRKTFEDGPGWGPDGARPLPRIERPAKPKIVEARVLVIDPDSLIAKMKGTIGSKLEQQLNALGKGTRWDGFLAKMGVSFKVSYTSNEPSAAEKAAMRPLDYPLYFIDEKTASVAALIQIMDEHLIPKLTPGTSVDIRDYVKKTWSLRLRGVTVPPGMAAVTPFRKCIFFKGRQVSDEAKGNGIFCVNSMLHELGHAHNITERGPQGAHPRDGSVMNPGLSVPSMSIEPLSYNSSHLERIIVQIGRLWRAQLSS